MKIVILSGEPSGDFLGIQLMRALKKQAQFPLEFRGVGGEGMQAEGLETLFPLKDITYMGLFEVLPNLFKILSRINQTASMIHEWKPDLMITIDAPDFSNRVAAKVRHLGIPMVHVVAPSVWAWRPGRAKKIAKLYDHLLTILPFEPPYFEKEGLPSTFIGHPILESGADQGDADQFRLRYKIDPEVPLVLVLPGSRAGEVSRHMPLFNEILIKLSEAHKGLRLVVPTVPSVEETVRAFPWPSGTIITSNPADKYDAMAASCVALAASGTVSLELAMAKLPMVIVYKVNPLTAYLVGLALKIKYFSILNILAGKAIIPEFIQYVIQQDVTETLDKLISSSAGHDQVEAYTSELKKLRYQTEIPSERAAKIILSLRA